MIGGNNMESRKIELTIEKARDFYKDGGKLKELALSVYTEEELKWPITDKIKTFGDACRELGEDNCLVEEFKDVLGISCVTADLIAYLKLRIICAALNEDWKPNFCAGEYRYAPYFCLYTKEELNQKTKKWKNENNAVLFSGNASYGAYAGLVYASSYYAPSPTGATVGSLLCLKSRELAEYCGRQFADIWADYLLIK